MSAMGSVLGLAYGDAIGKPVEFMSYSLIKRQYGTRGPDLPANGLVTDDTQMALAVGEGLVAVRQLMTRRGKRQYSSVLRPGDVELAIVNRFVNWFYDPQNNRAPGGTCLSACRALADGKPWWEAASPRAKGCGANMRVTVVGLCDWMTHSERSAVAQFQAALTHAHPTALAAADITQYTVWLLNAGFKPGQLLGELRKYCASHRDRYRRDWLGELWAWTGEDASDVAYSRRGWDQVSTALRNVTYAIERADDGGDVCRWTGEGWTAEEAFAGALLAFLRHHDDPVMAVKRAAMTNGDSDSIAALAGAFMGAYRNVSVFPNSWRNRIEYRSRLEAMVHGLTDLNVRH